MSLSFNKLYKYWPLLALSLSLVCSKVSWQGWITAAEEEGFMQPIIRKKHIGKDDKEKYIFCDMMAWNAARIEWKKITCDGSRYLCSNLVAALAGLDVDNLPHGRVVACTSGVVAGRRGSELEPHPPSRQLSGATNGHPLPSILARGKVQTTQNPYVGRGQTVTVSPNCELFFQNSKE